jgi:hypothetical protein
MNCTILAFLKFGVKEHILDLYENGTVYMNTIQYFKELEDKELRGIITKVLVKLEICHQVLLKSRN